MVRGEFVIVSAGELVYKLFKSRCALEVNEFAALDTNQVMMMLSEGLSKLVALLKADLDDLDYPQFCEELKRAVDACALGKLTCSQDFL